MSGRIYQKKIKGKSYYYYQESYREKVDPQTGGKYKGSGISRVRTNTIYLGDAQTILSWKMKVQGPLSVEHRAFGLLGAAYQTAIEFGLLEALKAYIIGERYGLPRWIFFLVTILNRLECATSKNQMSRWAAKTILPKLLGFDPKKLSGKNFWCVSDDIISEKELKKKRQQKGRDDLFCGLDNVVFNKIEEDVFQRLKPLLSDPARSVVYDTTNFFTFFESPDASELARTGHNKDSHHHLRQVGLAMAVDRELGIPFYHRVYRGNSQDAATFNTIVADLLCSINASFDKVEELVLVLDKGNNKKETFAFLSGKIEWVGSLVPSQHKDLLQVPIEQYRSPSGNLKTLRRQKTVMGKECLLVMTYSPKLFRKQVHTMSRGIEKLKKSLQEKYNSYKKAPRNLTPGLKTVHEGSRYKNFLTVSVDKSGLVLELNQTKIEERKKRFGKNLIFTSKAEAETEWVISRYKEKEVIEDAFKTMKAPELIRIRPLRHWTDSKIRAHIFCCVMSYVLLRLMQYKAGQAGLEMSAKVLCEELSDLKEVIMVYEDGRAQRKTTQRSSVQDKLYKLFKLEEIEKLVTLH
jgi:transposase